MQSASFNLMLFVSLLGECYRNLCQTIVHLVVGYVNLREHRRMRAYIYIRFSVDGSHTGVAVSFYFNNSHTNLTPIYISTSVAHSHTCPGTQTSSPIMC